ncbi:MAG: ECF transporter S component [Clostridium sp.]
MLAGAIGAGLSDFIAGYAAWVLPTIVLKGGWALIMGLIMYRLLPHFKYSWLAGAVTGGIFHVIGYTLVKIPLYGGGVAMAECFTLVAQTAAGIVLGGVAYTVLSRSPAIRACG